MKNIKAARTMRIILWIVGLIAVVLGIYLLFGHIGFLVFTFVGVGLIGSAIALGLIIDIAEERKTQKDNEMPNSKQED